ncbi:MAG: hypothetical protein HYY44_09015 [Deltaproteobacteria bacterium]|nr:hypothetical protein [Deltaproteobacteria bacterium]
MSRADIVRNVLLGLFAAAAAACGESGGSDPSDGGTDAIGSDGGDDEGSTSPPVTTARPDMGPEKIAPDPDAGTPTGPVTPDEVYYVARDFNTGATGYFYNSGDGALSALPEAFSYNAIFRTQQPSVTQPSGRLCVLERSGFTDVNYQSNVTCFERNAEGVWDNAWTDRGDDAALGSIVGGRMILGRRAGNFDMAVRSFTDSDWGYLPLSTFGEVIAIDLDSAEERHIPVADHGCMAPTAAVEAEDMIFTLAESEDG